MNQSNPQQDSSDETGGTYAVPKSSGNSGNRRRRGPLMVQRLRRRRALHQVRRLRRRSYATTTTSSSSSSEDEGSGAGTVATMSVARSSNGKRVRRRALRQRKTMPTREDTKWIWELQLDRLEAFLGALALVVATKVLVPNINFWTLVGPLRLALYTYGLLVGCTLSTIWVMCCLAFELTHD